MRDPDRRSRNPATVTASTRRGLFPLELGDLLGWLLPVARLGDAGDFGAGYQLRCRQEANRARLACPTCRSLTGQEPEP